MRATGLGFDELAQTIRGLGQDMSTTTTSGINAIENIQNSQVNRQKTIADIANINADVKAKGLQLEEDTIKVNELKRREAELNKPMSLSDVFGVITEGYDDSRKLTAVNKIPQIASLAGWTIDPDDQNKPILKNDGTAVTMRDLVKTGQLISAVYTHSANPLITTQDTALKTKAQLQKALPGISLGPGVEIDESLLQNLHAQMKAGKLSNDLIPLVNEAIAAQNDYRYVGNHPREVWSMYVDKLNLAKGQLSKIGGDTSMIDEAIKNAQAEIDKLPISKKAAKITGIEEGTMFDPKEIVTLGGHVAGYNQGIDTQNMRDATAIKTTGMSVAAQERAANRQGDRENKVAFTNNLIKILSDIETDVTKNVNDMVERSLITPNATKITPEEAQKMVQQEVARRTLGVYQQLYDNLGEKRLSELGFQVPEGVDKSTPQFRNAVAPLLQKIDEESQALKPGDPFKKSIDNTLVTYEKAKRAGDEAGAQQQLTTLLTAIEQQKQARKQNINKSIINNSKGLRPKTIGSFLFGDTNSPTGRGILNIGGFLDKE